MCWGFRCRMQDARYTFDKDLHDEDCLTSEHEDHDAEEIQY
jgi:hypothetical protein